MGQGEPDRSIWRKIADLSKARGDLSDAAPAVAESAPTDDTMTAEDIVAQFEASTETFRLRYRPDPTSRSLLVGFSTGREFAFSRTEFGHNVLLIADQRDAYFLIDRVMLIKFLLGLSKRFDRTVFFGGSKGGFGALLFAHECALRARRSDWRAVAFNPITLIGADAESVFYPSVRKTLKIAEKDILLRRALDLYGDLTIIHGSDNLHAIVVYPLNNEIDARAAVRLSAPNVRLFPLHFDLHNTLVPFVMRKLKQEQIVERLTRIYGAKDDDIAATAPLDIERVAREIGRMAWLPTLVQVLDDALDTPTNRTEAHRRGGAEV